MQKPNEGTPDAARPAVVLAVLGMQLAAFAGGIVNPYDYTVFVPKMPTDLKACDPAALGDRYNDHFQVIRDEVRKTYFAFWTQATRESDADMHIAFSKSVDGAKTWTEPLVLAGSLCRRTPHLGAYWQQPMLARGGRLYCLWNQQTDTRGPHYGEMFGIWSDDAGESWHRPQKVLWPTNVFRCRDVAHLPSWCIWQRPLRLGPGDAFFSAVTCKSSRIGFVSYDNVDDNPEVKDLALSFYHATRETMLRVPKGLKGGCCEEAGVVKLPDGRRFAIMRSRSGYPLWTQSRDEGRHWTEPQVLLKSDGTPYLHCCSPCPMYDWKGCEAGSGTYFALIHNTFDFDNPKNGSQNRGPLYLIAGTFDSAGEQPVRFGEPQLFAPRPSGNSFYTSYTVDESGTGILWFNECKYWLLGRKIDSRWFRQGNPAGSAPASFDADVVDGVKRKKLFTDNTLAAFAAGD